MVVPTDDKKTVKLGHFGDAKYYLFFELEDKKLVKEVENPYREEEGPEHGRAEKRMKIFELVKDADVLVYTVFGPGGEEFMKKRGKVLVRVKPKTTIEEALEEVTRALGSA